MLSHDNEPLFLAVALADLINSLPNFEDDTSGHSGQKESKGVVPAQNITDMLVAMPF